MPNPFLDAIKTDMFAPGLGLFGALGGNESIPATPLPAGTTSYYGTPIIPNDAGQQKLYGAGSTGDFLGNLTGGLFGSKSNDPAWRPYIQNGQYYWTDPSHKNAVPIPTVPGASWKPGGTAQKTYDQAQTISNIMPGLNDVMTKSSIASDSATQQAMAALTQQLYQQYGPQLNAIGNQIQDANTQASANRDLALLNNQGQALVDKTSSLQRSIDPEYYATRAAGAANIQKLLDSIDLSGALSTNELDSIQKGLAREGIQRGTAFAPSQTDTVSNAMRYGNANYQRQQTAKSNLSDALKTAAAFLPTAKSGVDAFQMTTGKPSGTNPSQGLFSAASSSGQGNQYGLAGNLFGTQTSMQNQTDQIASQKKDFLDKFNQFASGFSSILGSVTGSGGGKSLI